VVRTTPGRKWQRWWWQRGGPVSEQHVTFTSSANANVQSDAPPPFATAAALAHPSADGSGVGAYTGGIRAALGVGAAKCRKISLV
jgi:hypothetical protein